MENGGRKSYGGWRWTAWALSAVTLATLICCSAYALTLGPTVTLGASVTIGGGTGETTAIQIQHTPLVQGSAVTRDIFIVGQAGAEFAPTLPAFDQTYKVGSDFGPLPERKVRVRVFYRFASGPDNIPNDAPVTELPAIEGPDPLPFVFQITPSALGLGHLEYRILAERLQETPTGDLVVIGSAQFPAAEPGDPTPYHGLGVQVNASEVFTASGGRFALPDGNPLDGETAVDIPSGLLHGPTQITIDEIPSGSPIVPPGLTNPIAIYRLDASPAFEGVARVTLRYKDFGYPEGQDGIVDGTQISERDLTIVQWDGHRWRNIGAVGDFNANTLSAKVASLGFMAIVQGHAPTPDERAPDRKVITPNGDGKNDTADFVFSDIVGTVNVDIFDVSGRRVRSILMNAGTMSWDGRNDSGDIVESGVYIYQFTVDGKRVSGLIAVAK